MRYLMIATVLVSVACDEGATKTKGPVTGAPVQEATASGTSAPAAAPARPMPATETQFCDAVRSSKESYERESGAGANQLKLTKLRSVRKTAVVGAVPSRTAKDWIGTVKHLQTTSDGKAALTVTLPCGVEVKTWNNGFSDSSDETLINQSSPLFEVLSEMGKNQDVKFSGRFFPDAQNGFKETSMTEHGSMTEPEFLFRFQRIESLQ